MIATSTSRRVRPAPSATISPTTSAPASRSDRNSPVCRRSRISAPFGIICRSTARHTTWLPEATPSSVCFSRSTVGSTQNFGARAREEVKVAEDVSSSLEQQSSGRSSMARKRSYKYKTNGAINGVTLVSAERDMTNVAPELGVVYTPTREWQWRARVGTGYGTPQFSNLFVGPDGQPGNNTDLKSQTNGRLRCRRRLDTGLGRPVERDGLLRVLQKRNCLAIARRQ